MIRFFSRIFILFAAIAVSSLQANAQDMTVSSGLTLEQYVNEILLGNGIQAFNITYTGGASQLGHMTNGAGVFSVDEGLVLSSDAAENLGCSGPGFCNDCLGGGFNDSDLLTVANSVPPLIGQGFSVGSVNDGCVLEFDFVAAGDTVSFNYVFGSDEYLTWVNTAYNDVFAFFLSGPGITGPYDSPPGFPGGAVNIASVPNSNPQLPITISSVNNVTNSQYYVNNPGSTTPPCINGYTLPFTAMHEVQCGETYHIKLAIADGSDTALESIVVLEAGSFQSNAVVQIDLSIDVGGPDANVIYENCGTATLTFERPVETLLEMQEMVYIDYSGSVAINGVDYGQPQPNGTLLPLPDSVIFAPFVSVVQFQLTAAIDGISEGVESVQFEIDNVAACNGGGLTTFFSFQIAENPPPFVVEGYTTSICEGLTETIAPIVSGGYGNYTFDWGSCSNATTPSITVTPTDDFSCFVTVGDTCGIASQTVEIEVEVLEFPPLTASINEPSVSLDCWGTATVSATAAGGNGPNTGGQYAYEWEDQDGNEIFPSWWFGPGTVELSTWMNVEEVFVTVTDACGFVAMDSIDVTYNIPPIVVDVPAVVDAICNQPFNVVATAEGQGPMNFTWYNGFQALSFSGNLNWTSNADADLTLEVTDGCGQVEEVPVFVDITAPPVVVSTPPALVGPCTQVFNVMANVTSGSGGYQYSWTQNGQPIPGNANAQNIQSFNNTTLAVTVSDGCGQSGASTTAITIDNPPLVIELGDDISASCVDNTPIDVEILSGAGAYEYAWSVNGVPYSTNQDINLQSFFTVPVSVVVQDGCGGMTSDGLTYFIPDIPLSITSSEPTTICAGDGIGLTALATGGEEGFVYHWPTLNQYGSDQYIVPLQSAVYPVVATDICGASITAQVAVDVQYLFSRFTISMLSETEAQFRATPDPEEPWEGAYTYAWDFGDGATSEEKEPLHVYDGLGDYLASLEVTSWVGCVDKSYTIVRGPVLLYVPTAFTPNNDGINDAFFAVTNDLFSFEMWVFDRWGAQVFHSTDPSEVWNGSVDGGTHYASNGMYQWVIRLKGFNTDAEEFSGTVQLMR
jgi:gliding motility-associated-like protein